MFLLFFSKIIVYTDSNCKIITYYLIKQIFNHFNKCKKRGPFFKGTSYLIIYIYSVNLCGKYRGYTLYPEHHPGKGRSGWQ
jgi:hypothetical protein